MIQQFSQNMYRSTHLPQTLLLASILGLSSFAEPAIAQTPATSDDALRRLVSRIVGTDAQILVGQLPQQFPVALPILESAQIVGSVVSNYGQAGSYYQIFLDAPQPQEQVEAYYRQQLQAAGWTELETPNLVIIGFVSSEPIVSGMIFCKDTQELELTVSAPPILQPPTAVTLALSSPDPNVPYVTSCSSAGVIDDQEYRSSIPLPALTPAPDTQVTLRVNGGSDEDWTTIANIGESPLDNQALVAHYVAQLQQAGWQQQASNTTGSVAWSVLLLEDEQGQVWQGLLGIAQEDLNEYNASLTVVRLSAVGD